MAIKKNEKKIEILKKLRKLVRTEPFQAVDCEDFGAKDTWCSWGLCSYEFKEIKIPKSLICPHCNADEMMGCFYWCRYKKAFSKRHPHPDRTIALRRINDAIKGLS